MMEETRRNRYLGIMKTLKSHQERIPAKCDQSTLALIDDLKKIVEDEINEKK